MDRTTRGLIAQAALVIVDFDGTLAHLDVDWMSLKAALKRHAYARGWVWNPSLGLEANLRALQVQQGRTAFLEACDVVAQAEQEGFSPAFLNRPLYEALRQRSGPTAICSINTRVALDEILRDPVFAGFTPMLMAKEDVHQPKPHPEGLQRLCEMLQIEPADALFIGDRPTDATAAQALGMPFCWAPAFPSPTAAQPFIPQLT